MTRIFLLAALALLPLSAHADTKKGLAHWTCEDFTGSEDVFKPKLVYWATGAAKAGKPRTTTIDVVETEKIVPIIIETCQKDPKASFFQTLKSEWRKLEKSVEKLEHKAL
jgi:acid stress chaperone HdeA